MTLPASVDPPPAIGDEAEGHGVSGIIAEIPNKQPLARDGIWRVMLRGEAFGRLVRYGQQGRGAEWSLLDLDDMTDEQLDAYDAAMLGTAQDSADPL